MNGSRRRLLEGAAAGAVVTALGLGSAHRLVLDALANDGEGETVPFSREKLMGAARALAGQPYEDRRAEMAEELRALSYDAYRAMRTGPTFPRPLGPTGKFHYDTLLAGWIFNQPVELWIVSGDLARRVDFDRADYVFDPPADAQVPGGDIPFSGFRLRAPINAEGVLDEFAVFQGASYFRAVGAEEIYGLSARGLAIDTGQPGGEEFPHFRAFYIEEPAEGAKAVVVHALLDSPSTTGAYRITVRPGDATVTDVELTLFPRRDIETIGFAPFSSMFLFDGINRADFDDYRDAVHDSDGLSIHTGTGEWLWRPIANPERLEVSAFVDTTPRGFGLVQRKRRFEDYQDAEARYEKRPTAWVEPIGDWGSGAVVLFEIPSRSEANDNIVAYWQPDRPVLQGEPYAITYRIHWDGAAPERARGPRVWKTRRGRNLTDSHDLFVIDYTMNGTPMEGAAVEVTASAGKVRNLTSYPVPLENVLRVSFELDSDAEPSIELRVAMAPTEGPPAEKWLYRWTN